MTFLRFIKHILSSMYYTFRMSSLIRMLINSLHSNKSQSDFFENNELITNIVSEVEKNGFCQIDLAKLAPELVATDSLQVASQIFENLREQKNKTHGCSGKSSFLIRRTDVSEVLDKDDNYVKAAISGIFIQIANLYLKGRVRCTNIDYWLNFPDIEKKHAFGSQLWHRDYEDKKLIKLFIYFKDVVDTSGPFYYVRASHTGGKYGQLFKTKPPLGVVIDERDVLKAVDKLDVVKLMPKAGTIIFADTYGIHKGGHCLEEERQVFTCTYTTFAGLSRRAYRFDAQHVSRLNDLSRRAYRI